MQNVEEIIFSAHDLGLRKDLFSEVNRIKHLEENRYISIADLYDKAYKSIIKKMNETKTCEVETKEWKSALVASTTYDPMAKRLTVVFNNNKIYDYLEFSEESYQEFLEAESKGKHFITKIRAIYKEKPENVIKVTLEK